MSKCIMAPPTQGIWRSDDHVNAFKLVDIVCWLIYRTDGWAVYINMRWSTHTCVTTLGTTISSS